MRGKHLIQYATLHNKVDEVLVFCLMDKRLDRSIQMLCVFTMWKVKEYNNKHSHTYTLIFHTCTFSCEIAMGDLQSEEERDIVLELKLPAMTSPQQDTVLKATLSYFNVITSEFDTVQSELKLQRGGKLELKDHFVMHSSPRNCII